jgi:hypothetical protein
MDKKDQQAAQFAASMTAGQLAIAAPDLRILARTLRTRANALDKMASNIERLSSDMYETAHLLRIEGGDPEDNARRRLKVVE